MRKFFIFILMLAIGGTSYAQPQYWNHTAAGGGNNFPFNANPAAGKKVQWIIYPGDFSQPTPAPAGNNITAIWFYANTSVAALTYTNLTIRLATVAGTPIFTVGQWYTGAMTTVRAQNTTIGPTVLGTWFSIPLTTPYPYDPTMSLVVEVFQCGYTGTGPSIRQLPTGVSPNFRRQYSDATSACGVTPLATGGDISVASIGLNLAPAGCTFASAFGSATINPSGALVTISTCSFAGEYSTILGAVNGQTLRFTSSVATDWITIHSGTPAGPVIAFGQTPLTFANTFTGTVYAHWSTNAACGTQATCRTTTVQCTSCGVANDLCTAAININCGQTIAGTTVGATIDPVAACVTTLNTAPGVWYSFAGDGFPTTLSLCGSAYDTKIGVFSGSCAGLVCVTGNDDFCGLQSQVTFTSAIGTNYYVLVTGFGAATGAFTLARTCVGSCTITLTSAAGTNNQTRCVNQPITNITYATTGATGATFTGLPAGVTGVWAANVVTISGTPTAAGVFNYTVTLTGACPGTNATGTITVIANPTIGIIDNPTGPLCQGDPKLLTAVLGIPLVNYCFTQSTSTAITPLNSVACAAGGFTTDNSYWRVYPLTPYALPGPLTITSVRFGIEILTNVSLTARIYLQTGAAFPGGVRTLIRTQPIALPNQTLTTVTVPVTPVVVNPTDVIVIELFSAGVAGVSRFWIGSNAAAETGVSYLSAAPCGIPNPTDLAVIGFPNMNILLDFCGTTGGGGTPIPAGWTFLWSPAAGLNSTTVNPVAASPAVSTTYTVVVTNLSGCIGTGSIPITVNTRPAITAQPANATVCNTLTATFTANGTGTAAAYQWEVSTNGGVSYTPLVNAPPYSGVTTTTLTINPVTLAMNNNRYRMSVSGACPPVAFSNGAILTVNALPNVTVTPTSGCGGVAGINGLLLTASGANTYTWAPLAGLYTNATATIPYTGGNSATVYAAPTVFTAYTVTGTSTTTLCSNTASVAVQYTPPAPTVVPSSVTMCLGDPAVKLKSSSSTSLTATFTSGTVNINIPDGPGLPPVPPSYPATTSNITVSGIPAGAAIGNIRARFNITHNWVADLIIVLKAPNGNVFNLDALLSGTNNPGANFTNTVISSAGVNALSTGAAPWTNTYRADAAGATFTALGFTFPGGPAGYIPNVAAWNGLYSVPNGTWTVAIYDAGAPDAGVLNNWSLDIDYIVGVPATPAVWSPAAGLFSDAAAATPYVAGTAVDSVWTRPTPSGVYNYQATVQSISPPPAAPSTPMAGGNANNTISFNITNSNLISMNLTGISSNAFGSGAITARAFYKTSPIAGNPGLINAANGWNQFGGPTNSTVTAATLNPVLTGLSLPIPAGATYGIVLEMVGATFPAYSNGTGTTVGYTNNGCTITVDGNVGWGGPVIPGPMVNNPRNFNGTVYLSAGNLAACTSPARNVVVTVNQPLTVTSQPAAQTICTDKVATFSVAVAGSGPYTYQWEVSTDGGNTYSNVSNGGVYSGATTTTLIITAPPVTMSGYVYRCRIQGALPCLPIFSFFRILTVNPLPTIVIGVPPYVVSLFPGMTTTLNSTVSPVAASTYTWLRNGVPVSGANTGILNVNVDGLGAYQLRVTDINNCTNISNTVIVKDSASGKCFIYPNPNSGKFEVRYYSVANNVLLPRSLTVYDSKGDRVLTQKYSIGRPYDRMEVDMRRNGKGLYWVEIGDVNGNRLTMCRIVIQ